MKNRSSVVALAGTNLVASPTSARRSDQDGARRLATVEIELGHPELAALVHERHSAQAFAERLTCLQVSLAASSPDLAISLWLRFREMLASATSQSVADQKLVRFQLASAGNVSPEPPDPTPELLVGNCLALEALGRWRASVRLVVTARCISAGSVTPSRVLQATRDSAVAHVSDLDATVRRLAKAVILDRDDVEEDIRVEAIFVRAEGSRVAIRAVVLRPN